jgi:hypothetical protein
MWSISVAGVMPTVSAACGRIQAVGTGQVVSPVV